MSEQDIAKEILKVTEAAAIKMTQGSSATEKTILNSINRKIRLLELDAQGNIKTSSANLRIIRGIREDIEKIVVNKAYLKKVGAFVGSFNTVKKKTDSFFKGVSKKFNPNKTVFKEILAFSTELTKSSLTKAGINQNVIAPILDIINKGVTSGAMISDMENDLRVHIIGNNSRLGTLERYTSQITRDAINQYARNYNQSISSDLGMQWYYYSGSVIEDTRSYCKDRAGKYYHIKEVQDVPSQWAGMITGTNSSNIFINAGGYNCRHLWLPVLIDVVPESTIERNISNGNYSN